MRGGRFEIKKKKRTRVGKSISQAVVMESKPSWCYIARVYILELYTQYGRGMITLRERFAVLFGNSERSLSAGVV